MLREIDWNTWTGSIDMRDTLKDYYENGTDPGSYLERILICDPKLANRVLFTGSAIYDWLYRHMPAIAFGSIDRYYDWRKRGGRQGRLKAQLFDPSVARRVVGDEKAEQPVNE